MQDIYSTVIPQAPYVIGAYGLIWVTLVVFVGLALARIGRVEKELDVLEAAVKRRSGEDAL